MSRLWYIIGTLAVLVLAAILKNGDRAAVITEVSATPTPTPVVAQESVLPSPTKRPVLKPRATVKPPIPTYSDIAQQFAGNRIAFDEYCQAFPVENNFNVGTQVMLDNRSPDDRIVTIGGEQHYLRGYGWNVVTMKSEVLPATWAVGCGSARNVGKIVVEPLVSPSPDLSPAASISPSQEPPTPY